MYLWSTLNTSMTTLNTSIERTYSTMFSGDIACWQVAWQTVLSSSRLTLGLLQHCLRGEESQHRATMPLQEGTTASLVLRSPFSTLRGQDIKLHMRHLPLSLQVWSKARAGARPRSARAQARTRSVRLALGLLVSADLEVLAPLRARAATCLRPWTRLDRRCCRTGKQIARTLSACMCTALHTEHASRSTIFFVVFAFL